MKARSIWFGISVGLVVLAAKAWFLSWDVPAPRFDAEGVRLYRCGMGSSILLMAFGVIAVAAFVSITVTLAQKPPAPPPVPRMTAR